MASSGVLAIAQIKILSVKDQRPASSEPVAMEWREMLQMNIMIYQAR
jgi:hypothetical protein